MAPSAEPPDFRLAQRWRGLAFEICGNWQLLPGVKSYAKKRFLAGIDRLSLHVFYPIVSCWHRN
jgi:hypothetical protein